MTQKVIAIVGPTASGKTSLGIFLAKKLRGEVISADSRQVYRGLNLGTGKASKKEMAGIKHHLIDVVSPKRQFSADDFLKLGRNALTDMAARKKVPVVVGGTGLYTDALLGRMLLGDAPPNNALRAQLEKKSLAQLMAQLKRLDPARAKTVEPHHKRRIIRAIEIAAFKRQRKTTRSETKAWPSGLERPSGSSFLEPQYQILWLGLYPGDKKLKENISARLRARLKRGMLAEAKRLHKAGLSFKRMDELGLEYRYLAKQLTGELSPKEMEVALERAIGRYAKRQMRWFKRNKDIKWVGSEREALALAKAFISG